MATICANLVVDLGIGAIQLIEQRLRLFFRSNSRSSSCSAATHSTQGASTSREQTFFIGLIVLAIRLLWLLPTFISVLELISTAEDRPGSPAETILGVFELATFSWTGAQPSQRIARCCCRGRRRATYPAAASSPSSSRSASDARMGVMTLVMVDAQVVDSRHRRSARAPEDEARDPGTRPS